VMEMESVLLQTSLQEHLATTSMIVPRQTHAMALVLAITRMLLLILLATMVMLALLVMFVMVMEIALDHQSLALQPLAVWVHRFAMLGHAILELPSLLAARAMT